MQQKKFVPKHSLRGYLSRRSTEELEALLADYLQEDVFENYCAAIPEILAVLEERFEPDFTSEQYICAKEMLLKYEKDG